MAIATRPKPNIHHKKRRAQHHRQSKLYLKPYWPYLPMVAIVGAGAVVNHILYGVNLGATGWLTAGAPLAPTRIDAITGQAGLAVPVALMTIATALIVIATHWYRFHRFLSRGEEFVVRHPWLDILLVTVLTTGVILTRSA